MAEARRGEKGRLSRRVGRGQPRPTSAVVDGASVSTNPSPQGSETWTHVRCPATGGAGCCAAGQRAPVAARRCRSWAPPEASVRQGGAEGAEGGGGVVAWLCGGGAEGWREGEGVRWLTSKVPGGQGAATSQIRSKLPVPLATSSWLTEQSSWHSPSHKYFAFLHFVQWLCSVFAMQEKQLAFCCGRRARKTLRTASQGVSHGEMRCGSPLA